MQLTTRTHTRQIKVGQVAVGGGAPVSVQTMTNADPHDRHLLLRQIEEAAALGCDIVRLTVPDQKAARVFGQVRECSKIPLIADIHFDHRLALAAIAAGADGLRINPGNIGAVARVRAVALAAQAKQIPIRIGVNGGSLEPEILARYGSATAEALVASALRHVALLEEVEFYDIKISVKASDVPRTLEAYRLLARSTSYPLHLGVTEAGTFLPGTIRSSVALGALLLEGIGDTLRVSLADTPAREVRVGVEILRSIGLRAPGAAITACPTCGRTRVDVAQLASAIENHLEAFYHAHPRAPRPRIAVMGCIVNGPGEAAEADIALCGGTGKYVLYIHGKPFKTIAEAEALNTLTEIVRTWPHLPD